MSNAKLKSSELARRTAEAKIAEQSNLVEVSFVLHAAWHSCAPVARGSKIAKCVALLWLVLLQAGTLLLQLGAGPQLHVEHSVCDGRDMSAAKLLALRAHSHTDCRYSVLWHIDSVNGRPTQVIVQMQSAGELLTTVAQQRTQDQQAQQQGVMQAQQEQMDALKLAFQKQAQELAAWQNAFNAVPASGSQNLVTYPSDFNEHTLQVIRSTEAQSTQPRRC